MVDSVEIETWCGVVRSERPFEVEEVWWTLSRLKPNKSPLNARLSPGGRGVVDSVEIETLIAVNRSLYEFSKWKRCGGLCRD